MREVQEQPLGSLLKDFGLWFVGKLWEFIIQADKALGDVVLGNAFCPVAMTYGRYIPCFHGHCYFHQLENNPRFEESRRAIKMSLLAL